MRATSPFLHAAKTALVALCLLGAQALSAQTTLKPLDTWSAQILGQIRHYETQLELSGQSHEVHIGHLDQSGSEYLLVTLEKDNTYYILGVCDHDCQDLDLELYDLKTDTTLKDDEPDDYPLIVVTPAIETTYRIKVIMANCDSEPCRYGIAVYKK